MRRPVLALIVVGCSATAYGQSSYKSVEPKPVVSVQDAWRLRAEAQVRTDQLQAKWDAVGERAIRMVCASCLTKQATRLQTPEPASQRSMTASRPLPRNVASQQSRMQASSKALRRALARAFIYPEI